MSTFRDAARRLAEQQPEDVDPESMDFGMDAGSE